jgi:hypothetical protein
MGTKSTENDKKGKQKQKKPDPKSKKRSERKRDGFDPNIPLTFALLDEDWNYAEWQAFPRATKDYISKHRALHKRSAGAMTSQTDEARATVTFVEPPDNAGEQFAEPNRRQ